MGVLLSLLMVFTLALPAFAAETTTGTASTFTITAPATKHQYEIYQIFTGELGDNNVLTNVKWGQNGKNGDTAVTVGDAVDADILDALTAVNSKSDAEKLAVIETYANLTSPVATITEGQTYSAVAGYYLIKDKDKSVTGEDTYTTYIVKVVGNVTITPKGEVPHFEKKLKDINDSTDTEYTGWQDSADYDIGDKIPFKLEGTVASNYADYKTYYFAFHDKEEDGLTFDPTSVKVSVVNAGKADVVLDSDKYTLVTDKTALTDGCSFEVIFNNLKDIPDVVNGSIIRVEYQSELNNEAVLGKDGNVNSGKLEFSNNPNEEQNGTKKPETGETPWDNVIVFTYKVVVNKYANSVEEGNRLAGAEFTLSKILKDGSKKTIAVTKSDDGTTFTFKGLDDGQYILEETVTPANYNTIDPITFKVTADHKIEWTTEQRDEILTSLSGEKVTGEITLTASADKDALSTDIINMSGATLPETGGIGTTIFYIVGGLMMAVAAVLLITKKRMSNNK